MKGRLTAALTLLAVAMTQLPINARAIEVDAAKSAVPTGRTEINIARIKSALKLTSEQQAAWTAVENAIVAIAREQAQEIAGTTQPVSRRVVAVVLNSTTVSRLAAVAMPLIRTLDAEQKKVALVLAQQIGLGAVAAFI
jgi:hypothetical protein